MAGWRPDAPAGAGERCTQLAMGIVFFALLTPVGLALRLAGRDSLGLRFRPQQPTYWVPRELRGGRQLSMAKQS